jgi:hypothetical protein
MEVAAEGDGGGAGGGSTLIPVPVATILVRRVLRTPVVAAAAGASRFFRGACSAQ